MPKIDLHDQGIRIKAISPFAPIERIISAGGISGLIAIIIAAGISGRYFFHGPEEVPSILGYALSTIIGFYFGSGITRAVAGLTEQPPQTHSQTDQPSN